MLKRFGYYSTESQRPPLRISALVPQAPGRDPPLDRHVRLDPRRDRRLPALLHREPQLVRDRLPAILEEAGKPHRSGYERTDEHASHIIEALETGRTYRGHFNVKNDGVITNLPDDASSRSRLRRPLRHQHGRGRHAADACAATCLASVNVQRMAWRPR